MSVYTVVTLEEAARFLAPYDVGPPLALEPIAEGVVNTNYRLTTAGGRYILTLVEDARQGGALPWIVALLDHLAARGIPCPAPLHARDGEAVRPLLGKAALVVSHLAGHHPQRPTVAHCRQVGEMLARLHRAGADFAPLRPNPMGLNVWRLLWLDLQPLLGREEAELLGGELAAAERGFLTAPLPSGCCHIDLFPDNVLFDQGRLSGVIDFHYAGGERLLFDLAVTLDAWAFGDDGLPLPEEGAALLAGYDALRPLMAVEREWLPHALRLASLRFSLTRLHARLLPRPGPAVTTKAPEAFLQRLRWQRHHPLPW